MRCAACGDKITGKPIKKGARLYCSIDCAEATAEDRFDEDETQDLDEEFDEFDDEEDVEYETDSDRSYFGEDDDAR